MATPEKPSEPEAQKAPAKGPKRKAGVAVKPPKKARKYPKSARALAIELLQKAGGRMKFGELTKAITQKMGGKLTWVPTYYMKSPGFSKPEKGIVAYSETEEAKVRATKSKTRKVEAKARAKAKRAKKAERPKGKGPKKETVLERRQRTAAEKARNDQEAKREFDEAAAAKKAEVESEDEEEEAEPEDE